LMLVCKSLLKHRSKKGNGFSPLLKITKFAYFLTENLLFTHQNVVGPYIVIHGWKDTIHMDILVPRLGGLVMILKAIFFFNIMLQKCNSLGGEAHIVCPRCGGLDSPPKKWYKTPNLPILT
jgi:hypothetical protein